MSGVVAPWTENEDGPECACGEWTVVKIMPDGTPVLMCLFHTREAGAITKLPAERPPDWYDRLPNDDQADGGTT